MFSYEANNKYINNNTPLYNASGEHGTLQKCERLISPIIFAESHSVMNDYLF